MTIKIEYTGHLATITGLDDTQISNLKQLLSYEMPGAEFVSGSRFTWKKGKRQYNPRYQMDTRKYLFDTKYQRFPAGLVTKVQDWLRSQNLNFTSVSPWVCIANPVNLVDKSRNPRYYQTAVAEAAKSTDRGIFVLPTGTGKSCVTAMLASMYPNKKILVTVPNLNLLTQTSRELKAFLGCEIGIIGDGEKTIQQITVSTIQSLVAHIKQNKATAKDDLSKFLKEAAVWIADECHSAAADSYVNLSKRLINANRRYGLTATAFREDNKELVMEGILGPISYTYSLNQAMQDGYLTPVNILLRQINHDTSQYMSKPSYQTVYKNHISSSKTRNTQVVKDVQELLQGGQYPCLVVVDQINHGEALATLLDCEFISGKEDDATRQRMLADFGSGTNKVLIGSSVMNVGVDIPTIKSMINAAGSKSATLLLQRIGRSLRLHKDKQFVTFIDYNDHCFFYLKDHSDTRESLYLKHFPGRVRNISQQDKILN